MPKQLIAGYNRFRKGYFQKHKSELTELALGQDPSIAVLSCCDSRVDPTIIFDTVPGELFVIRNVANLVPQCENDKRPRGTSTALEFAVTGLNVSHIVVLGHAQCGGIMALMDRETNNDKHTFIDHWMAIAEPIKKDILSRDLSPEERYTECEKATIAQSLRNLMTFPWIKERVEQGTLRLHGWYYDLDTATLSCFDPDIEDFLNVPHEE